MGKHLHYTEFITARLFTKKYAALFFILFTAISATFGQANNERNTNIAASKNALDSFIEAEGKRIFNEKKFNEEFSSKWKGDSSLFEINRRKIVIDLYRYTGNFYHDCYQKNYLSQTQLDSFKIELDNKAQDLIQFYTLNPYSAQRLSPIVISAPTPKPLGAYPDGCENCDFDLKDFSDWKMYEGLTDFRTTTPFSWINEVPVGTFGVGFPALGGPQHSIITTPGIDANAPIQMRYGASGATALLGDGMGKLDNGAASIRRTFLVTNDNYNYFYHYALVIENPAHNRIEMPYFYVTMTGDLLTEDEKAQLANCANREAIPGDGNPNWKDSPKAIEVKYLDWQTAFIPLQAFIGKTVTIDFRVGDCIWGGHYSYAYIETECKGELIIPAVSTCKGKPVSVSAPEGGRDYRWNAAANTIGRTLTTDVPGEYTVTFKGTVGDCETTAKVRIDVANSPVAKFTTNTVCQGNATSFKDLSTSPTGIKTYAWDFYNDNTSLSNESNPVFTYPSAATYSAKLTITDNNGCMHDTIINVEVAAAPVAEFTSDIVCANFPTSFKDKSTGKIATYEWDFYNDNSRKSALQNPTFNYPIHNTTTKAKLTVTTEKGCVSTITHPIIFHTMPKANFTQSNVCFPDAMTFNNTSSIDKGSIAKNEWDFGDLAGVSALQNPNYAYSKYGKYEVKLLVTSDNGCVDSISKSVSVFEKPTINFSTQNVCDLASSPFKNSSLLNSSATFNLWNWDILNDNTVEYTTKDATHIFAGAGTFDVRLKATTSEGCSNELVKQVTIHPSPLAQFTVDNICISGTASFQNNSTIKMGVIKSNNWSFGDKGNSHLQNPLHKYANEGNYITKLKVISDQNCADSVEHAIAVWPLPIPNFTATDVCLHNTTIFTNTSSISSVNSPNSITSQLWDFDNGKTDVGKDATYKFNTEGIYNVKLITTSSHNCIDSISKEVVVFPLPKSKFSTSTPQGCATWCVDFENQTSISTGKVNSYTWNFGDGNSSTKNNPSHCFINTGISPLKFTISLHTQSDKGCVGDTLIKDLITVFPITQAQFSYNPIELDDINNIATFTDESTNENSWLWKFGEEGVSTNENPTHSFISTGDHYVTLKVNNAYNCSDSITKKLHVSPTSNYYIPNAFTPNGDGFNDVFYVRAYNITDFELFIYNRWGEQIFVSNDINLGWNGKRYNNMQEAQIDTYVYKVFLTDILGKKHEATGLVTLIK